MSARLRGHTLILLLAGMSILAARCDFAEPPQVCTSEFVTYSVQVLTPGGQPADSVAIHVENVDTGHVYDVCESLACEMYGGAGAYLIFHDGIEVSTEGDRVAVTGMRDSLSFEADYVFRAGVCHVRKVAGPDQVRLRR